MRKIIINFCLLLFLWCAFAFLLIGNIKSETKTSNTQSYIEEKSYVIKKTYEFMKYSK